MCRPQAQLLFRPKPTDATATQEGRCCRSNTCSCACAYVHVSLGGQLCQLMARHGGTEYGAMTLRNVHSNINFSLFLRPVRAGCRSARPSSAETSPRSKQSPSLSCPSPPLPQQHTQSAVATAARGSPLHCTAAAASTQPGLRGRRGRRQLQHSCDGDRPHEAPSQQHQAAAAAVAGSSSTPIPVARVKSSVRRQRLRARQDAVL